MMNIKVRRSIGELAVSRVLDTTGAPPWRLYTQTDGQDRGACVVAWGLRRSTEYRPLHNGPAVNQDAPVVKIFLVNSEVATGAYCPKLEFENHKKNNISLGCLDLNTLDKYFWKSHDKIDHLRLV